MLNVLLGYNYLELRRGELRLLLGLMLLAIYYICIKGTKRALPYIGLPPIDVVQDSRMNKTQYILYIIPALFICNWLCENLPLTNIQFFTATY